MCCREWSCNTGERAKTMWATDITGWCDEAERLALGNVD